MEKKLSRFTAHSLFAWAFGVPREDATAPPATFVAPSIPEGVAPQSVKLANDNALISVYQYANQTYTGYNGFMGYPLLSQLTTIPEYRMLSEKTAMAMVRKWIKVKANGEGDKSKKIAEIESEMERLNVRELFGEVAIQDGFFGRGHLFIDLGEQEGENLAMPIVMDKAFIHGKLRKFKVVEAVFTYPNGYDAVNPLADNFYAPREWYVMGKRLHATRLLTFVGRPVPDILKPAYNFGGMSMSQLAKSYVDNWTKTRNSVNKIISNYVVRGLKTNMQDTLMGGSGSDLLDRAQLFTQAADNQGMMLLDKDTEDFFTQAAPLTTLDALQAQSQEHMASVASMPLSILLGITPTGLNASTDGEIRTFYDHVLDMQTRLFKTNLEKVMVIIQLHLWGTVDTDIYFEFVSLWQQTETELATNRKSDAETAAILVETGAITTDEARDRLRNDETSGYNGLRGAAPEPEMEEPDNEDGKAGPT